MHLDKIFTPVSLEAEPATDCSFGCWATCKKGCEGCYGCEGSMQK